MTRKNWVWFIPGILVGGMAAALLVAFVGMPLALGHRNTLPLEKFFADMTVSLAVKLRAGSAQNPYAQDVNSLEAGRLAFMGACAVCHGANGDGKGMFGQAIYPPATDLRGRGTQEKSDAELYWIIQNGLSFAGMPAFGEKFSERNLWNLVTYVRSLGKTTAQAAPQISAPTAEQFAKANPQGDAAQRGAATYFAMGCHLCHGALGDAPGVLRLRPGPQIAEAVRQGRSGMPIYNTVQINDTQLSDLVAYVNSFQVFQ